MANGSNHYFLWHHDPPPLFGGRGSKKILAKIFFFQKWSEVARKLVKSLSSISRTLLGQLVLVFLFVQSEMTTVIRQSSSQYVFIVGCSQYQLFDILNIPNIDCSIDIYCQMPLILIIRCSQYQSLDFPNINCDMFIVSSQYFPNIN